MPETIRIGTVRYLNAWPLVYGLEEAEGVELRAEAPSALGPLLRYGEVDVALVPSIEYFRLAAEGDERLRGPGAGGYLALPVAAIGSRGPIGSVRLFGYAEPEALRRVLLDPSSRTSNVLARLLLARRSGVTPHFVLPEEAARSPSRPPDAEVVIGDRALTMERPEAKWVLDLGEEWERFVHLPFVYAMWVVRAGGPQERVTELLSASRDRGLEAREGVAARGAEVLGMPIETARRYLLEQVHYAFGPREQKGLRAFYRMAAEDGLAPEGVRLRVAKSGDTDA